MAIVLFWNALTSEERKQTDGNGGTDKAPVCTICHEKRGGYKLKPQAQNGLKHRYLRVHQGTLEALENRHSVIGSKDHRFTCRGNSLYEGTVSAASP
jgi:hypothetical protein